MWLQGNSKRKKKNWEWEEKPIELTPCLFSSLGWNAVVINCTTWEFGFTSKSTRRCFSTSCILACVHSPVKRIRLHWAACSLSRPMSSNLCITCCFFLLQRLCTTLTGYRSCTFLSSFSTISKVCLCYSCMSDWCLVLVLSVHLYVLLFTWTFTHHGLRAKLYCQPSLNYQCRYFFNLWCLSKQGNIRLSHICKEIMTQLVLMSKRGKKRHNQGHDSNSVICLPKCWGTCSKQQPYERMEG